MNTSAPMLAEKLRFLVDGKFVQQSALADACGVSPQAVTGWKRTGRIAKKHLAVIADMSGVTVEWLLSPDPPSHETVVAMRAPKPRWPFQRVTWDRHLALSRDDRADLDARLDRIVAGYEASNGDNHRKSNAGRASG